MKKLIILLIAAIATFGCSNDETENSKVTLGELSLDSKAISFEIAGGQKEVTVTSNSPWRLIGNQDWCKPSITEGKNGDKVTFTAVENPDAETARSVTYTFICGDKAVKFDITQKQTDVFEFLTDTEYAVNSKSQIVAIKIKNNLGVTYQVNPEAKEWLSELTSKSVVDEWFLFSTRTNTLYTTREATLTFKGLNGDEKVVKISQAPTIAMFVDKMETIAKPEGETIEITVDSNVDYTVEVDIDSQKWIKEVVETPVATPGASEGLISKKHKFTISAEDGFTRVGKVTFKNKVADISRTITISQKSKNPTMVNVPDAKFSTWLENEGYVIATATKGQFELTASGRDATSFSLSYMGIKSVVGIEAFKNLEILDCTSNYYMTTVDLSKNTKLVSFKIDGEVTYVNLGDNEITEFEMRDLYSDGAENLTIIGSKLAFVDLYNDSNLKVLDITGCPKIRTLNIDECYNMEIVWMKTGQTPPTIRGNTVDIIQYK